MKRTKLLILTALWLIANHAMGTIVNGVRQMPTPSATQGFVASKNTDTYFYLYNIGAKAFFTEGNDYGTQASVGMYGLKVAFTADAENEGAYIFNDFSIGFGQWKIVFFDSKTTMYVDWNNQANYRWGVKTNGNTFRLYASDKGNPGFGNGWWREDCYEKDRYVGLDGNDETTALFPYLEEGNNHYIDWAFVTEETYNDYLLQAETYDTAEQLRTVMEEAKEKGIDVQSWQTVYLNEQASLEDLTAAIAAVYQAINEWTQQQAANASVAKPFDYTEKIINPKFDYDDVYTGWWGTEFSAYNPNENAEHFNKTYDTYQTIEGLPAGIYSVGVKAFYRAGDAQPAYDNFKADNEAAHYAKLYASCGNTICEADIVSPCSAMNTERQWEGDESQVRDNSTGETFYIPNNMVAGEYYMHTLGFYDNHVLVPVDESGTLTIGVRKTEQTDGDWSLFDDFSLIYYGNGDDAKALYASENTIATELVLTAAKTTLSIGETVQITPTFTPANVKTEKLIWNSSDTKVATVSATGLVTAEGAGTTEITAVTTDGSNIQRSVTIRVKEAQIDATALVINEIMAANVDEFVSPAFNFDGWLELYNPTNADASLASLCLSDDANNLTKWKMPTTIGVVPAKGYKVIWFDSNNIKDTQAPFKLDVDGGTIYLSTSSGTLIASQTYPQAKERVSYARTQDGGDTWGEAVSATPGATNNNSQFATTQLAAPVVDQPSQVFNGSVTVFVSIPSGATLRYTTDGSLPTLTNGERSKSGMFIIDETTNYRFRLFADGKLPSTVTTRSYILNDRNFSLPIISVVGDNEFLYGQDMGVMVRGNGNGRPGNGQSSACNWNMDWDRPVNFSYIDTNGEMVLNQDVDLEMCGGWSRAWEPHSFKLKGTKEMGGNKHLPYAFFDQKPYIRNRTLQIRNGGNDNNCRFKDASLAYIVQSSGVDVDVQSYQPAHEFVNGKYIGVLNVREPNNKHYVYANSGWDDDEIDQWEMSPDSGYVQKCGTPDVYNELCDVLSPDAANPETYQEICQMLDIDEFTYYMAIQFYYGGSDWPRNNVKAFRHRDGGKFRFVLFDVDAAFDYGTDVFDQFMNKEIWTFDQLYPTSLGRITDHIRMVTLFKNLIQNADYRRKFIDTYCLVSGSIFEVSRAQQILDMLYERVEPAMQVEGRSAYSTYNSIRSRVSNRLSSATQALRNYSTFGLSRTSAQQVTLASDVEGAQLMVNGLAVPTGKFNGNLFSPVTLKAVAPAGYAFQGWLSTSGSAEALIASGSQWTYYDQGSLDDKNWTSPSYSTSGWQKGNAPLGYGKDGLVTTLDYGSDSRNKRPTYYFRTTLSLTNAPKTSDKFTLNFTVDDGIIVYVNGSEAGRYNMPSGNVSFNSYASSYAPNNPDTGSMELDASLFRKGTNTIAVELHNNSASSTDIYWDAELTSTVNVEQTYYSTDAEIKLPGSNVSLTASYRPLTQSELAQQGINTVRINEISGSNSSLINEYFKKNDWIELYNTTDAEVDVEGMYLTDNLNKPEKYKITKGTTKANTVIPAHGYLIIWCDKLETTDQALHASFKIDGEGGVLQLMAADKSWKDTIYYGTHDSNHTVGRYPDGCADVYVMNVQTIAKANVLSSYVELTDQEKMKEATAVPSLIASANGFRIRYGAQQLLVKSESDGPALVEIFTTDGRQVERQSVTIRGGKAQLSVAHLHSGFYVARAINSDGTRVSCKFMK